MARGRTVGKTGHRFASYLRRCGLAAAALLCIAGFAAPGSADDDPVKATLAATVNDGYARLIFDMSQYDDASVRVANNVLVITFKRPIDVSVDRLTTQIPDYVGAARRDPDGKGIRVALSQQVKVNATPAAEKLFIDLLPASWSGQPPSLPPEVIADLARRAREADRLERKERQAVAQQRATAEPVRVHVATQPTFTRYIFAIPANTSVSSDRVKERLTLTFDAPIKFDLADVVAALPRAIGGIDAELRDDAALVRFNFLAKVDVRTFRDDGSYVVDVVGADNKPDEASAAPAAPQQSAAPETTAPATVRRAANERAQRRRQRRKNPTPRHRQPSPRRSNRQRRPRHRQLQRKRCRRHRRPTNRRQRRKSKHKSPRRKCRRSRRLQPTRQKQHPRHATPPAPQRDAAAAPDKAAAAAAPPPRPHAANTSGKVAVELTRQGANLKLSFPFAASTAAAVFNRADTLWIVFDSNADIDLSALDGEASRTVRGAELTHTPDADIVRIKLDHPHLASVDIDGPIWTVQIGDTAIDTTHALTVSRNLIGPNRSSVTIPFNSPHLVHRLDDPDAGDTLVVVTAFAPARGFINERDFVEFHMLASAEGVVVDPLADDVKVELAPDKIIVSRPMGLALSTSLQSVLRGSGLRPTMFDSQLWGFDQQAAYTERQSKLVAAAASAPDNKRLAPRLDLARFYVARDMYPEAKGVLDVALADERAASEQGIATVLRAVTEIMMNRPDDALKDLADPSIGDQHDAPLWRALAYAKQGKWGQARDGFKSADAAVATLPVELQRVALKEEMRSAIEVGDFSTASIQLNDFQTIGVLA